MPGWVCRTPLFSFNVKGVGRWFQQARSFFLPLPVVRLLSDENAKKPPRSTRGSGDFFRNTTQGGVR